MSQTLQYTHKELLDYDLASKLGWVKAPDYNFRALIDALDCQRDFYGVGIVYNDGFDSFLVRAPTSATGSKRKVTHIVISRIPSTAEFEARNWLKKTIAAEPINTEMTTTVLSCGAVVLYFAGTILLDGATVLSGGVAAPLAIISTMGTVATGLQCLNGLVRIIDIEYNDSKVANWLDSQEWYTTTITALDLISLAGASGDLYLAVKTFKAFKSASTYATVSMKQWLQGLNRAQRMNIAKGVILHFNPSASIKQIRAWIAAGKYPKNIDPEKVIDELIENLNNVFMASMGFTGSWINGVIGSTYEYSMGLLRTEETIQ
ncbi:hypothetical protein EYY86_16010 [Hafnia paralvei]|uniref:hypothetical protein n=1 Tax=Hafnia paralvei TaxID=546367 RepID=UPI001034D80B|nr:hypothetical protein [Hafnia paralvei]TBM12043.1 hypothetical protein EYY86_16010 [Hafnia paralvei]